MASEKERAELDERAQKGETVVPGDTGGSSLQAQEHLAQGRSKVGQKGGRTSKDREEMNRETHGQYGTKNESAGERAAGRAGIDVDEAL